MWLRWGKKTKGIKRHIAVDTMGNLLKIVVHEANIHDTKAGILVAKPTYEKYPTIKKFCADAGYRGTFVDDCMNELSIGVDISEKIKPHQWEVLPFRWIVERNFAWFGNSRRLSKNYEFLSKHAENMAIISYLHTLLKRF